MPLALVELECALAGLVRRLPGLRLAVPCDQLEWSDPKADVGLKSLPVKW
jgi:nitric oxide reductase